MAMHFLQLQGQSAGNHVFDMRNHKEFLAAEEDMVEI
jgi:hypothetical protein